jgi:hypothetical protein
MEDQLLFLCSVLFHSKLELGVDVELRLVEIEVPVTREDICPVELGGSVVVAARSVSMIHEDPFGDGRLDLGSGIIMYNRLLALRGSLLTLSAMVLFCTFCIANHDFIISMSPPVTTTTSQQ